MVHSALRPPMAYCASPGWLWWWRNRWNDWQGKPKYSEKTCPSAALSTTNLTCCPYANPGRRGGKPATNRLSYGTAKLVAEIRIKYFSDVTERELVKLTPWRCALLEKSPVAELLKDFPTFHRTRMFITTFTRALHWSLPSRQINPVHTTPS
jgi:hypothetical protein